MRDLSKPIHAILPQAFAVIGGATFMLSGFLKAMDSGAFARLLGDYGIPYLEYTAPVIIITEVLMGFLLITGIKQRIVATLSVIMLIIFTAGFGFGVLFRDVTDCGCFGDSGIPGSSPEAVFIRNVILMAMLLFVAKKHNDTRISEKILTYTGASLIVAASVTAFMAGRTFRNIHGNRQGGTPVEPEAVADTALADFITVHPDSSYLVFAFSYSCPHCLNSIANLNNYVAGHAVDKVIGIAAGTAEQELEFRRQFNPAFVIVNTRSLKALTRDFPRTYYILRDSVVLDFAGELPCAQVLHNSMRRAGLLPPVPQPQNEN